MQSSGPRLHCRLEIPSASAHLLQLYTGFGMLARGGAIDVTAARAPGFSLRHLDAARLRVTVTGLERPLRILYDTRDGPELEPEAVDGMDAVFKRSFDPDLVAGLPDAARVRPLGLNYPVYGDDDFYGTQMRWGLRSGELFTRSGLAPALRGSRLLSRVLRVNQGRSNASVHQFEGYPQLGGSPRVLFMARVWPPERARTEALREERHEMNVLRAECVRRLRAHFGPRFSGGLEADAYTARTFPDALVPDATLTRKSAYLTLVRGAAIGVATRGLQGSNGWKLAEYVAGAKAIVSQPLAYRVPGGFRADTHYLPFTTADECVARSDRLVRDDAMRHAMMRANFDYYRASLRPDALVLNSLVEALAG